MVTRDLIICKTDNFQRIFKSGYSSDKCTKYGENAITEYCYFH